VLLDTSETITEVHVVDAGLYELFSSTPRAVMDAFVSALGRNSRLAALDLHRNLLGEDRLERVAPLAESPAFTSLDVAHCELGAEACSVLGDFAASALRHLNISYNHGIGPAILTLQVFRHSANLVYFNASATNVDDQTAVVFGFFAECPRLETLVLSQNNITHAGVHHLTRLVSSPSLRELDLSFNLLRVRGVQQVVSDFEHGRARINLVSNGVPVHVAEWLAAKHGGQFAF
jgi:hypothetical protein